MPRQIGEEAMPRYKCKSLAALDIALSGLPAKMRVEADARYRRVCKDRWRASQGDDGVREFGDNNTAGTSSRKRSKNQQSYRSDSHLAEKGGTKIPKKNCSFKITRPAQL